MEIPVVLIGPDKQPTADPVVGFPCIRLALSSGENPNSMSFLTWALLDTGADSVFVDVEISNLIGAPEIGRGQVTSATHTLDQSTHEALLTIDGLPPIRTVYKTVPFPKTHIRGRVILGRSFIRRFDFRFDCNTQRFSLSLPTP